MSIKELTVRLQKLELEVAALRKEKRADAVPWWRRPRTVAADDPHHAAAERFGREYRLSQRRKKSGGKQRARAGH